MNVLSKVGVGAGVAAAAAVPVAIGIHVGNQPTSVPMSDEEWNAVEREAAASVEASNDELGNPYRGDSVMPRGVEEGGRDGAPFVVRSRADVEATSPVLRAAVTGGILTVAAAGLGGFLNGGSTAGTILGVGLLGTTVMAATAGISRAISD